MKYEFLLPEMAFHELDTTGETILIKRGERGYYPQNESIKTRDFNELNAEIGVSKAQAEAMKSGSMFGWDIPATNPEIWEEVFSRHASVDTTLNAYSDNK